MISKHKVLASMIRSFFGAYTAGIIDSHVTDIYEKHKPQTIKKVMLEHYEQISVAFHDILFYPIAHINYTEEEITRCLQDNYKEGTTMIELVQLACKTDEMHKAMIAEYKRHFESLLQGHIPTASEHEKAYIRGGDSMETSDAIKLVVRIVMTSYSKGVKQSGKADATLHQPSILKLTLDAMNVLLSDEEADSILPESDGGLAGMFYKACKKQEYFQLMTEAMDKAYGTIADDDDDH